MKRHIYQLTAEEETALEESLAQARRGEFATDEKIAAIWKKHGLSAERMQEFQDAAVSESRRNENSTAYDAYKTKRKKPYGKMDV